METDHERTREGLDQANLTSDQSESGQVSMMVESQTCAVEEDSCAIGTEHFKKNTQKLVPRAYQLEILARAQSENVIVYMETGTGKTLIACLLIQSILDPQNVGIADSEKKAVFVVNQVLLVQQQSTVLRENLKLNIGHYHGGAGGVSGIEFWERSKWQQEYFTHDVMVMTAQIFLDNLRHGYIKMSDFALLVFDECHHTTKKHPYNCIMSEFYKFSPEGKRPKILGLTASPINVGVKKLKNNSKFQQKWQDLEVNLDAKIISPVENAQASTTFSRPTEIVHFFEGYESTCSPFTSSYDQQFTGSFEDEAKYFSVDSIDYVVKALGPWCAARVVDKLLMKLQKRCQRITAQALQASGLESHVRHLRRLRVFIAEYFAAEGGFPMHPTKDSHMTAQVMDLLSVLLSNHKAATKANKMCCIVFVQRRYTAEALSLLINAVFSPSNTSKPILSAPLMGAKNSTSNLSNEKKAEVKKIIHKLNVGELQVLVATSVAEEGLDIQPCQLVIRFNPLQTLTSYIQSRGRARHPQAKYIVMLERDRAEQVTTLQRIHDYEGRMRTLAKDNTTGLQIGERNKSVLAATAEIKRYMMTTGPEDEQDCALGDVDVDVMYVVESTGATVSMQSAISLLHQYCSLLPKDTYCDLRPVFAEMPHSEGKGLFKFAVTLPVNSPVRRAEGVVSLSKMRAKQIAALEACKRLHRLGGLDAHLNPPTKALATKARQADKQGVVKSRVRPYPSPTLSEWWFPIPWADVADGMLMHCSVLLSTSNRHPHPVHGIISAKVLPRDVRIKYMFDTSNDHAARIETCDRTRFFSLQELRLLQRSDAFFLSAVLPAAHEPLLHAELDVMPPVMLVPLKLCDDPTTPFRAPRSFNPPVMGTMYSCAHMDLAEGFDSSTVMSSDVRVEAVATTSGQAGTRVAIPGPLLSGEEVQGIVAHKSLTTKRVSAEMSGGGEGDAVGDVGGCDGEIEEGAAKRSRGAQIDGHCSQTTELNVDTIKSVAGGLSLGYNDIGMSGSAHTHGKHSGNCIDEKIEEGTAYDGMASGEQAEPVQDKDMSFLELDWDEVARVIDDARTMQSNTLISIFEGQGIDALRAATNSHVLVNTLCWGRRVRIAAVLGGIDWSSVDVFIRENSMGTMLDFIRYYDRTCAAERIMFEQAKLQKALNDERQAEASERTLLAAEDDVSRFPVADLSEVAAAPMEEVVAAPMEEDAAAPMADEVVATVACADEQASDVRKGDPLWASLQCTSQGTRIFKSLDYAERTGKPHPITIVSRSPTVKAVYILLPWTTVVIDDEDLNTRRQSSIIRDSIGARVPRSNVAAVAPVEEMVTDEDSSLVAKGVGLVPEEDGTDENDGEDVVGKKRSRTGAGDGDEPSSRVQATERWKLLAFYRDDVVEAAELLHSLYVHPIRLETARAGVCCGALYGTLEQRMIAADFKREFFPGVEDENLLLHALAAPSAQIEGNYERLETLGDGLLKLLAAMHVSVKYPAYHEGQLTAAKDRIVSNKALFEAAIKISLPRFILSSAFVSRKFLPLGYRPTTAPAKQRHLSDKTLADVMEALMGVRYIDSHKDLKRSWYDAIVQFKLVDAEEPYPEMRTLISHIVPTETELAPLRELEDIIGYKFKSPILLVEAVTHASISPDSVEALLCAIQSVRAPQIESVVQVELPRDRDSDLDFRSSGYSKPWSEVAAAHASSTRSRLEDGEIVETTSPSFGTRCDGESNLEVAAKLRAKLMEQMKSAQKKSANSRAKEGDKCPPISLVSPGSKDKARMEVAHSGKAPKGRAEQKSVKTLEEGEEDEDEDEVDDDEGNADVMDDVDEEEIIVDSTSALCYQRLEFLGDAVLGLVATDFLYRWEPHLTPGLMTDWRSMAVCNEVLGVAVLRAGFHKFLRHASDLLADDIRNFERVAKDWTLEDIMYSMDEPVEATVAVSDDDCRFAQVKPPKVLGDLFEAILGAMFVDSDGDIELASRMVHAFVIDPYIIRPLSANAEQRWGVQRHPVSVVEEIVASLGCKKCDIAFTTRGEMQAKARAQEMATGDDDGDAVDVVRTMHPSWAWSDNLVAEPTESICTVSIHSDAIRVTCTGHNKKMSKKRAAAALINARPEEFLERMKNVCNCKQLAAEAAQAEAAAAAAAAAVEGNAPALSDSAPAVTSGGGGGSGVEVGIADGPLPEGDKQRGDDCGEGDGEGEGDAAMTADG